MSYRSVAALAIGRRRVLESLIHPGFYVAVALGLAVAYALVSAFVRSVDSGGFDSSLNPVYGFFGGLVIGVFGEALLMKLFASGPLLFALHLAFIPVLLYLAMSSIFRFGTEKSSGTIELLSYGPSDGTAYFLAGMIKDLALTLVALAALMLFMIAASLIDNLAIDPVLVVSVLALFCTAATAYAYGVFVSILTQNASSALALFLLGFVFFLTSLVGSYATLGGYVHNLSAVAAEVVQWFSPFFYWAICLKAATNGDPGMIVVGLTAQLVFCGAILTASHFIIKAKGIRG